MTILDDRCTQRLAPHTTSQQLAAMRAQLERDNARRLAPGRHCLCPGHRGQHPGHPATPGARHMNPLLIAPLLDLGKNIIDRMFPDPAQKAQAELELLKITQAGDLQVILKQLEINATEAANPSIFVAGWRPFVGWLSGLGLAYATIVHNLLAWLAQVQQWPAPPAVDTDTLLYVLGALLGVAGLRTVEKVKGATK